ncbi:hypothetical protein GOBAR_AA11802 [Gossypium barbadense]|uniref:Uncharacterized protein n=1 Tax=Gossypium barbadense TaxID=3634 RepID=A0A2P5XZS0_GOSBA|nr:hypothetical protein GOBAR_AA11802 [Gossypium barbadense]
MISFQGDIGDLGFYLCFDMAGSLKVECEYFADCAKHDPVVNEDIEKHFAELLTEELKLREVEGLEIQQHVDMALLEAKKLASQYQKEADKCNSSMETCEEAREKAEEALPAQMKLTTMWEIRTQGNLQFV